MSESFPRDCSIKIVADELFFMHVGKNSTEKTIGYMISVIDRANDIFKRTNWLQYRTLYKDDGSVMGFLFFGNAYLIDYPYQMAHMNMYSALVQKRSQM